MYDNLQAATTMEAPAALGAYSQAVKANGFVFVSGQLGIDPATGELDGVTAAEQAARALKNITNILAAWNISFSSVVQKERKGEENVSLVILTHLCEEKSMKAAISEINALAEVRNNVKFIRIEDL